MGYYIMSDDGELIERLDERPTLNDVQQLAMECECGLWVIEGEHAGITVDWPNPEPRTSTPKPRLVFGEPIPPDLLEHKPEQQKLSLWKD